jgi:hypothetical protein
MSQSLSSPMPPSDPSMGGDPAAAAPAPDAGGDVVVTIVSNGDGTYMVYAGDEPDAGGDMSMDDAAALGPEGDAAASPSAQGEPAGSVGEALKAAMTILQADASSQGAPGSADDQLNAGFSASKSPTPASSPAQKY